MPEREPDRAFVAYAVVSWGIALGLGTYLAVLMLGGADPTAPLSVSRAQPSAGPTTGRASSSVGPSPTHPPKGAREHQRRPVAHRRSHAERGPRTAFPIQHVVIIDQENHSFDNVLGALCVKLGRCDGTRTGFYPGGASVPLARASDYVPVVDHSAEGQTMAIDGGRMNGFGTLHGCTGPQRSQCYSQFSPSQIPNLAHLARHFVIADHTFSDAAVPSWGSHLDLVAQTLDGFLGDNPIVAPGATGWGCDSGGLALWHRAPHKRMIRVPSCVPTRTGLGPFEPSPVPWVPTIMDRMDRAGVSWKIYQAGTAPVPGILGAGGYGWSICPTFADCLYSSQGTNMVPSSQVIADAQAGTLPNVSFVIPTDSSSQHNGFSMTQGDNWIGQVVSAIENSPAWPSTAIFITYDDCGCFYDHVAPPPGAGIRVPMVIVSPWAKRSHTDSHVASFSSMIAFIEHDFGLAPLSRQDAHAYDFRGSFDFHQRPVPPVQMVTSSVPLSEQRYIAHHPLAGAGAT